MTRVLIAAVAALAVSACGAAAFVVKGPVTDQCGAAGLQRCDELTQAVFDYVDGNKAAAEPKLRAAARANQPEKLRAFAKALEPITKTLDGQVASSISGALAILSSPDADSSPGSATRALGELFLSPAEFLEDIANALTSRPHHSIMPTARRLHSGNPRTLHRFTISCGQSITPRQYWGGDKEAGSRTRPSPSKAP